MGGRLQSELVAQRWGRFLFKFILFVCVSVRVCGLVQFKRSKMGKTI